MISKNIEFNQKTLMKQIYLLVLLFSVNYSFGCLATYQFKVFPVGIEKGKIITMDFKIHRTHQNNMETDEFKPAWILYSYISTYNKNQKLLSCIPMDTSYFIGTGYLDSFKKQYLAGYNSIMLKYPAIELFIPEFFSFCDFQKKCKLIQISYDSLKNINYLQFNKKNYTIEIIKDSSYYAFGGVESYTANIDNISSFFANSIRIYKSKGMKIVLVHLNRGQELIMEEKEGELEFVERKSKEYFPDFDFKDIKTCVYEEPLIHHAFGFDVFVVE